LKPPAYDLNHPAQPSDNQAYIIIPQEMQAPGVFSAEKKTIGRLYRSAKNRREKESAFD
jgi:hypothetical protein